MVNIDDWAAELDECLSDFELWFVEFVDCGRTIVPLDRDGIVSTPTSD